MKSRRYWLACLVLLSMSITGVLVMQDRARAPEIQPPASPLSGRTCPYVDSGSRSLKCYWYLTAEGFRLPVAVFRHSEGGSTKGPLVYLSGGPGQGGNTSAEMLAYWATWLEETDLDRDLVLFDYRGLAPGTPSWDCPEYTDASRELLARNVSLEQENHAIAPVLQRCLKRFAAALDKALPGLQISPLSLLSTRANADDVAGIVDALDYQEWHALGVSYGTRVGLVAALQNPGLDRLILDSPYPLQVGGASQTAELWPVVFSRYWKACQSGILCSQPPAVGEKNFWRLLQRLKDQPVTLKVKDWHRSIPVRWRLNDLRLLWLLNSAMYSRGSLVQIDDLLAELQAGGPVDSDLPEQFYNQAFDPGFNSMVFLTTECNDNLRGSTEAHSAALENLGPWREYFKDDSNSDICRSVHFEGGNLPPMTTLSKPVLVAGGYFDPVTPPEFIGGLLNHLPNGVFLRNAEVAHAEFYGSRCGLEAINRFLNLPESEVVNLPKMLPEECRAWR